MVRLEKILYERLLNTRSLGRARQLGSPSKWYTEPRGPSQAVTAAQVFNSGIIGTVFHYLQPVLSYITYQWQRDFYLQRGLALEDMFVFQDRQLRRDPFFEHIQREGFHPYTWLMHAKRRARYYKVERAVKGTYAPDWLRNEAAQRTLVETAQNKTEYDQYVYDNYMSDMTPSTRPSVLQKLIFLEFLHFFGLFRLEAWDRFFYNEVFYQGSRYSSKQLANPPSLLGNFNLQTEDGRRRFELEVTRFQQIYPGALTREGEKFDFKTYYALEAIKHNRDLAAHDPAVISQLRQEIQQTLQIPYEEKSKTRAKKSGFSLPSYLQSQKPGTGVLSQ